MKVLFRVDASTYIGTGHVIRCLSFAEVLRNCGCDVVFVMRSQPGDLCDYIESRGFIVDRLHEPSSLIIPKNTEDYMAWLQVGVLKDLEDFIEAGKNADIVVVDHYGIDAEWESNVKSCFNCKIIAIDDLVRKHSAELIIDQTVGRNETEYHKESPDSKVLAGTEYALINGRFANFHLSAVKREIFEEDHKILLTMGGVDSPNATLKVLEALARREILIQTTVLISHRAPHFDSVSSFSKLHSNWVTHIPFSEDMASLMLQHTIAIGAPGTTSWERACMGLPAIIVPLADNQQQICENLIKEGAAISLSFFEINSLLNEKLDILLKNFDKMRLNTLKLCDGKGVERVISYMRKLGWL